DTDGRLQSEIRSLGSDSGAGKQSPADNRLNELSASLAQAEADRIQKESLRDVVNTAAPESIAEAAGDAPARDYLTKLTDLRRELAEQSAILTPAHYKVRQIQDQITVLETALKNELARVRTRVNNDYRSAEERERMLSDEYLKQSRAASDVAARSVSLDLLRHQSDADWTAYAAAFEKARALSLGAITPANDIRIVDTADAASRPSRPNLPLNLAVALFGGLLIGIVQAVFRDRSDVHLHTPAEAADLLGFPELAAVPQASRKTGLLLQTDSRGRGILHGNGAAARQLVKWARRKPDPVSDSFRQAAASLCLRHDMRSRVIVVTSPGPGEGKTTVVSNLAATLALLGNRVLLVDGDLRRPRLHEMFQLPNRLGLSGLIGAEPNGDGLTRDVQEREEIQPTDVPGLFVLTSGSVGGSAGDAGSNIANLLCSPRMRSLIRRLRHDFDIVLIDSPPALLGADARLLARLSDGVVMVLRSGETRRDAALAALDRLLQDRSNVFGYILNGWDAKADQGYYSGMYRHYQAS
ncbi:MAG TPA: polysaccharide biosynthesis tyrosine autokinase, partial [Bryobacteraceae bacterium]|nr:polysaccharide biosynthesis tyrosine autokinase [Bryobacteraceae bacterium]